MNIGIVTTWFERGAAYVSKAYVRALSEENQVFIYARGGEARAIGDPEWDTPNVTWAKTYPMPNTGTYIDEADFSKWLLNLNIDVVFFNEQNWWQTVLLCKRLGVKTGAYIDYYTELTLPLFGIYDFLICNTKRHFSAFSWHPQCHYVPWGTDVNVFHPQGFGVPASCDGRDVVFFHSAGMSPRRKGTDLAICAFDRLIQSYANCRLLIHSQADLENALPEVVHLIKGLKAAGRLEVITKTVPAPGLYHLGDVYLYPSRLEGIGLTVAEAISCGLPVVTIDNAPMNEFIEPPSRVARVQKFYCRADGYYWPISEVDIDSFCKQMEFFLRDVNNLSQYRSQAREYALNHLDWNQRFAVINRIFASAERTPLGGELVKMADSYDNIRFPYITRFPKTYSLALRIARTIKRISTGR
ncbi:glycosyltransferase family 4 protein [Pseudoduganella sp. GCM10020061]|uniref:glycosyltransferase family 4 protein n=1 Tax=Pseudoduganella sp. GCM10020061 TaxID=3317345 RepID=UPI00363DF90E